MFQLLALSRLQEGDAAPAPELHRENMRGGIPAPPASYIPPTGSSYMTCAPSRPFAASAAPSPISAHTSHRAIHSYDRRRSIFGRGGVGLRGFGDGHGPRRWLRPLLSGELRLRPHARACTSGGPLALNLRYRARSDSLLHRRDSGGSWNSGNAAGQEGR